VVGIFFIITYIFALIYFIRDAVTIEKTVVLYFDKVIGVVAYFIDKNGKVYHCYNCDCDVGKYYNVIIKNGDIRKVLEESTKQFELMPLKESYWLNWYSPVGNFNDMFLLPIIYIPLVIAIVAIIMFEGCTKIYGVVFGLLPFGLIVYDLICKINVKRGKETLNIDLMFTFNKVKKIITIVFKLVVAIFIVGIIYYFYSHAGDEITRKVMFVFFILAIFAMLAFLFPNGFNIIKVNFTKIYISIFGIFWITAITKFILANKDVVSTIMGIIFIVPMVVVLYFEVIRK